MLRRLPLAELRLRPRMAVDAQTLQVAAQIVEDVRTQGEAALRAHALRLGDLPSEGAPLVYDRAALEAARDALDAEERALLERVAARIETFARAQRDCLRPLDLAIPGGRAGHEIAPVERAGCYAPSGRFPLPSSVLMTAVTARVAGVSQVWVASPRPLPITLAAAAIAGADALLAVGGAQAIAAFAFGAGPVPACDAVVGPGNRFVTAAKQLVAGQVAIDMLAGPSELVVLADDTADADRVAADLLAQAEHDPEALPALVTTDEAFAQAVDEALARRLAQLPTAETAREALKNGFTVVVADLEEGRVACDLLAPEHLQLHCRNASALAKRLRHYGGLFIGSETAEVLGDYGAGPNHTLPTGGTARFSGGLSVLTFLRVRTWIEVADPEAAQTLVRDAAHLARLEGLIGHQRSAEHRLR